MSTAAGWSIYLSSLANIAAMPEAKPWSMMDSNAHEHFLAMFISGRAGNIIPALVYVSEVPASVRGHATR